MRWNEEVIGRVLLGLLALPGSALAQDSWMRWPPRADVATAPVQAASRGGQVDLILQRAGDHVDVLVDNPLAGPVQAIVSLDRNGLREDTAAIIQAGTRSRVVQLPIGQTIDVQMKAIPGIPGTHASPVDYRLPVPAKGLRVDQGAGGHASHGDGENGNAIDFAAPMGTPVTAAREGVVMDTEQGQPDQAGANPNRRARANYVRVLHDDGSMALYGHLKQGSVVVKRGQRVAVGQRLGSVGNSGYSTAPHLHFVVQTNADRSLKSIPVRVITPQGELKLAK